MQEQLWDSGQNTVGNLQKSKQGDRSWRRVCRGKSVDSYHSRRFPSIDLKKRRTFTQFTTCKSKLTDLFFQIWCSVPAKASHRDIPRMSREKLYEPKSGT